MLSDDPASGPDMKSWAQITGHDLVSIDRVDAVFRFWSEDGVGVTGSRRAIARTQFMASRR
jgi:hypothetical protein